MQCRVRVDLWSTTDAWGADLLIKVIEVRKKSTRTRRTADTEKRSNHEALTILQAPPLSRFNQSGRKFARIVSITANEETWRWQWRSGYNIYLLIYLACDIAATMRPDASPDDRILYQRDRINNGWHDKG